MEKSLTRYLLLSLSLLLFLFLKDSFAFGNKGAIPTTTGVLACANVHVPATAIYCNGEIIPAANFTSDSAGATFTWTNTNTAVGIASSGSGNIPAFTAVNNSLGSIIVANITVTPHVGACSGVPALYTIVINPTPSTMMLPLAKYDYCFGDTVKITLNSTGYFPLVYHYNNLTYLAGAPSSTTYIKKTAIGAQSYFFGATDYIADSHGCQGPATGSVSFNIHALPTAVVSGTDSACFGTTKKIKITLTGVAPWYITYDSAGLSPITIKRYTSPVYIPVSALGTWKYTVSTVADSFCSNVISSNATIKIKAIPSLVAPTNQSLCAGNLTTASTFTSIPAGANFTWTNSNTSIGLALSGSGNVPAFSTINSGSSVLNANISVTPILLGCAGTASSYTISVNPKPTVILPANQSVCDGTSISATALSSTPSGATYTWTNSNTSIGLGASGNGNVPTFVATNPTTSTLTGTINVTPDLGGCIGNSSSYTITLKASPASIVPANQSICEGNILASSTFTSNPPGAAFNWTNSNTGIGLPASGSTTVQSFVSTNGTGANINGTISVSAVLNGCSGPASSYDIQIKTKPIVSVPSDQSVCVGVNVNSGIFSSSPAGASYSWTNSTTLTGLAANGSGNTPIFVSTNPLSTVITSTITVIPTLNGCIGTSGSYEIEVKPSPTVIVPAAINECDNTTITAGSFSSIPSGASYSWTNNNTSIGLGANGIGDLPSFLSTNPSSSSISGNIVVVPTLNGCPGPSSSLSITIKARPMAVVPASASYCSGALVPTANYTSIPPGAAFGWVNSDPSIGTALSGSNVLPAFNAINASGSNLTATIEVAAILNNCMGPNVPYTITVKPEIAVFTPSDQEVCAGSINPLVSFTSSPSGASYTWTNSNTALGLAASGNGNVPAFTAVNSGNSSISSLLLITPTLNGCTGSSGSYFINVNPKPSAVVPSNQNVCDGNIQAIGMLTSNPAGATFSWVNSNASIGLSVSGTGNIPAFTASNSGITNTLGTVSVTPSLNGCIGSSSNYVIQVYPLPQAVVPAAQSVCDGTTVNATTFSSIPAGATYTWTNTNTAIGLASSGTGNVPTFVASNTTNTSISATITVTPHLNGCVGNPSSFTISVNPKPDVILPPNVEDCPGTNISASSFSSVPAGATFSWTNSNTAIGLAASGNGNIPSFSLSNLNSSSISSTIWVTPSIGGCIGNAGSYTIKVNPRPQVTLPSNQLVCAGSAVAATTFSSATSGVSYNWTCSNTSIGLAANGIGNLPGFTSQNSSGIPITATITVEPNGLCSGVPNFYDITVNPLPVLNSIANQSVCAGGLNTATNFSTTPLGASYTWTNSNASIGLANNGTGNVPAFAALNAGSTVVTGTVSILPTLNGCIGNAGSYTIDIQPKPAALVPSNQSVCDGAVVSSAAFASNPAGATFNWTNSNTSIGLGASGSSDLPSFTAINTGSTILTTNISVVPTLAGCIGNASSFQIQINPKPTFSIPSNLSICDGSAIAASNLISVPIGANYTWTNSNTSIGLAASGNGDVPAFTASNSTTLAIDGTIAITPILNGCAGNSQSYQITVNPKPIATIPSNQSVCVGTSIAATSLSSTPAGANYTWNLSNTTIGLPASGTGNVPSFISINNSSTVQTGIITVTPSIGGCAGNPSQYSISVKPSPVLLVPSNQTLCAGDVAPLNTLLSVPSGASFSWTSSNTAIGLPSSGNGDIPSFTALNSGLNSDSSEIKIYPILNGCIGKDSIFKIKVNPIPVISPISNVTVCAGDIIPATSFQTLPSGSTFSWSNNNTTIGLASSGNGNIPSFTSSTTFSSTINLSTIIVLPNLNGCTGVTQFYSVQLNPLPSSIVPSAQTFCDGALVSSVHLTSNQTSATFNWTNSNSSIGLGASGTGDIPNFTASNSTLGIINGTISVTASLNGCSGSTSNYVVSVNPNATAIVPANLTLCENDFVPITSLSSSPSGALFSWTNSNSTIGLGVSGSGNIPAFTSLNGGITPLNSTITVVPTLNGCIGTSGSFTVQVKPSPILQAITNQNFCAGASVPTSNYSSNLIGSNFSWLNSNTAIGLGLNGTGNTPGFTAINSGSSPLSSSVDVIASYDGCVSNTMNYNITVNPIPDVQTGGNQTICAGTSSLPIAFTSSTSGTSFSWTNDNTSIGIAASGSGNIASFNSINLSNTAQSATITVIPSYQTCTGSSATYNLLVNPIPVLSPLSDQTVCEGTSSVSTLFASTVSGTTFNWTNTTPTIGLASSGSGDINSFLVQNTTGAIVNALISVSPEANSCVGSSISFTISSVPAPEVVTVSDLQACVGTSIGPINFTSNPPGSTYTWTNDNSDIGIGVFGSGAISAFSTTNSTLFPDIAHFEIVPSLNGCLGDTARFSITVQTQAKVQVPLDTLVCGGTLISSTNFVGTPSSATFTWKNNNLAMGLAAQGIGDVPSFSATNNTGSPLTGTITVTPIEQGCAGIPSSYTIQVNSKPQASFTFTPNDATIINPKITFIDNSKYAANYSWEFGDGFSGTGKNIEHDYLDTGCFVVTLLVTTIEGCADSIQKLACIKNEIHIYIPDAFTPNNDGLNDIFIPVGTGITPLDYEMTIYNRKSTLIFMSNDIQIGWNGKSNTLMQDDKSPMETYVYKIRIKDEEGKFHFFTGQINLIR